MKRLRQELGCSEAHLTGGEPTAYPELPELIEGLRRLGYCVKMTSNGQFVTDRVDQFVDAGLTSINFSIHTLRPYVLAKLQSPARSLEWAAEAFSRQISNLLAAKRAGIHTKINMVVTDTTEDSEVLDLVTLCREYDLELRLLDDLAPHSDSLRRIDDLLSSLGAVIVGVVFTEGSSACAYDVVAANGHRFRVKSIRPVPLKTLCSSCNKRHDCKEWFYGIRIEQSGDIPFVRLCLHRQNYPAVQKLSDFFHSVQYEEIYLTKLLVNGGDVVDEEHV